MLAALGKDETTLSAGKKKKCISEFAHVVRADGEVVRCELNGATLCLSARYEKEHPAGTIKIIQLLANRACRYRTKMSECDYYVMDSSEVGTDSAADVKSRYYSAVHGEGSKKRKLLTLGELCRLIGISEGDLATLPMPTVLSGQADASDAKPYYSTGNAASKLSDLLQKAGFASDDRRKAN